MQFLKRIIKENFFPFLYTSTLASSSFLAYISYIVNKNKTNFERSKESDKFKDTTRLDYEFYGIDWGVASDNMVYIK